MKIKKSVLFLSAACAGVAIMLTSYCKKSNNESSVPTVSNDQTSSQASDSTFTFTAKDGHLIGVNANKGSVSKEGNATSVQGCGGVTDLKVLAQSGYSGYCVLANTWITGVGNCNALYLNGKQYVDPKTGYGLWLTTNYGVTAWCNGISGGIQPGEIFKVSVRTYCNMDTTGSVPGVSCFDSPVVTYIVPTPFDASCSATIPPKKGGGRK